MTQTDPLAQARAIMKQQALDAGQRIMERWHNHPSTDFCGSQCPGGGTGWDGKGLVSDHFPARESDTGEVCAEHQAEGLAAADLDERGR